MSTHEDPPRTTPPIPEQPSQPEDPALTEFAQNARDAVSPVSNERPQIGPGTWNVSERMRYKENLGVYKSNDQTLELLKKGFPTEVLNTLDGSAAQRLIESGMTFEDIKKGATMPTAPVAARMYEAVMPKEKAVALGKLGFTRTQREQLSQENPNAIDKIIELGIQASEVMAEKGDAAPQPFTPQEAKTVLKTQLRKSTVSLDGFSKEEQQRRYGNLLGWTLRDRDALTQEVAVLMQEAEAEEAAYLQKLEAHAKGSGFFMNKLREATAHELMPAELKAARESAQRKRQAVLKSTIGSISARRARRGGEMKDDQRVIERYTRRYGVIEKTILDPLEKEAEARERGLSDREAGAVEKAYESFKKLPEPVRIMVTSALFVAGSAALAGAPLVPALISMGSTAAAAVAAASVTEPGPLRTLITAGATGAGVLGIVGLGLNYLTRLGHKVAGTKDKADAMLAQKSFEGENLAHWDVFRDRAQKLMDAQNAEKRIKRDAAAVGIFGSIMAGAAAGSLMGAREDGGDTSVQEQPSGVVPKVETTEQTGGSPVAESGAEVETAANSSPLGSEANSAVGSEVSLESPLGGETDAAVGSEVSLESPLGGETDAAVGSEVSLNEAEAVEVTISEGDYAGKALLELKDKLAQEYRDVPAENVPPSVKHILESHNVNELAHEYGFAWGDATDGSQSLTLQPGDTIEVKDGQLVFTHGGEEHVLSDAAGKVSALEHADSAPIEASPSAPAESAPAAETPAAETPPVAPPISTSESAVAAPTVAETTPPPIAPEVESPAQASTPGYTPLGEFGVGEAAPTAQPSYTPGQVEEMMEGAEGVPTGPYTNPYDTYVDPQTPVVYNNQIHEGTEVPTIYGGTPEQMQAEAENYLKRHPDATLLFDSRIPQLDGSSEQTVGAFVLDEEGSVARLDRFTGPTIPEGAKIDPDNFTKPLRA